VSLNYQAVENNQHADDATVNVLRHTPSRHLYSSAFIRKGWPKALFLRT